MGHDNLSSEAALVTGARIVGRIDYINYLDYQSGGGSGRFCTAGAIGSLKSKA